MMNVVGKIAVEELNQQESERKQRLRVVPDAQQNGHCEGGTRSTAATTPRHKPNRLGQALVTPASGADGLTVQNHTPPEPPLGIIILVFERSPNRLLNC